MTPPVTIKKIPNVVSKVGLSTANKMAIRKNMTPHALNAPAVAALANEGLTQAEIATELDLNKSSVSRHLRNAKGLGLLHSTAKAAS